MLEKFDYLNGTILLSKADQSLINGGLIDDSGSCAYFDSISNTVVMNISKDSALDYLENADGKLCCASIYLYNNPFFDTIE